MPVSFTGEKMTPTIQILCPINFYFINKNILQQQNRPFHWEAFNDSFVYGLSKLIKCVQMSESSTEGHNALSTDQQSWAKRQASSFTSTISSFSLFCLSWLVKLIIVRWFIFWQASTCTHNCYNIIGWHSRWQILVSHVST